jgi:hypothetical protein
LTAVGRASHSQTIALNAECVEAPEASNGVQDDHRFSEQDVVDQANQLGAQEWELVSVVRVSGSPGWRGFFKRLKKD